MLRAHGELDWRRRRRWPHAVIDAVGPSPRLAPHRVLDSGGGCDDEKNGHRDSGHPDGIRHKCHVDGGGIRLGSLGDALKEVFRIMSMNTVLTSLSVADNRLMAEGVRQLCDALSSKESKLRELDLSFNQPGGEAYMKLCQLVRQNSSLTRVSRRERSIFV